MDLYKNLYQRRLIVRLVGIRFSNLVEGGQQMHLFENDEKIANLSIAMDKMRQRYGDRAVLRAVGMDAKTIGRWNPFTGEPPPLLANRKQ